MQKKSILAKLIPVLLILGVLWSVFFVGKMILQKAENNNLNFIPKNSLWYAQIDLQKLIKNEVETLIFSDNDKEILLLLEELIENKDSTLKSIQQNGIQINSIVLAFGLNDGITGILFNLTSSQKFNASFSTRPSRRIACKTKDNVGVLLFSKDTNTSTKELKKKANDFFNGNFLEIQKSKHLIAINLLKKIKKNTAIEEGEFTIDINKNQLLIDSQFESSIESNTMPSLHPENLHIDWQQIPSFISDSLRLWTHSTIPDLKSISINYTGSDLVTEPLMKLAPIVNTVLQLNDSLDFNSFLGRIEMDQLIESHTSESFIYAGTSYFYKQTNYHTIYVGRDKFDPDKLTTEDALLSISGSPESITNIVGKSLARKLLGILPLYKASDKLSHSVENIDVELIQNQNGKYTLHSIIQFKESKYATNELLKFILAIEN